SSVRGRKFSWSHAAGPAVRHNRPQTHDRVHLYDFRATPRRQRLFIYDRRNVRHHPDDRGWTVIFFFASAAASSAYLTISETFPLEIRALAIAFFYAIGTGIGGVIGPVLFGILIETGSRASVFGGYLLGAVLMIIAATVQVLFGVAAERRSLEDVARPLAFELRVSARGWNLTKTSARPCRSA